MQDIGTLLDSLRDQERGAVSAAIGEARLLIQSWINLPGRRERSDMVEYLLDASTLLTEVARGYE